MLVRRSTSGCEGVRSVRERRHRTSRCRHVGGFVAAERRGPRPKRRSYGSKRSNADVRCSVTTTRRPRPPEERWSNSAAPRARPRYPNEHRPLWAGDARSVSHIRRTRSGTTDRPPAGGARGVGQVHAAATGAGPFRLVARSILLARFVSRVRCSSSRWLRRIRAAPARRSCRILLLHVGLLARLARPTRGAVNATYNRCGATSPMPCAGSSSARRRAITFGPACRARWARSSPRISKPPAST